MIVDTPAPSTTAEPAGELVTPILLLINGNSRRGREAFEDVQKLLAEAGIPIKEAVLAKDKAETERLLRREIEAGAQTVIVGGGDGTLSLCAEYLVGTQVAMAVLPLGTGNTFVRSIGIPVDMAAAIENIAKGEVQYIDVGKVNDQIFLNSVSLGLSATIAKSLTKEIKKKLGVLSWPYIGLKVMLSHRPMALTLIENGQKRKVRTHQLVVANGRYVAGPIRASDEASLQDSELTVFTLGGTTKFELIKTGLEWLANRHVESNGVKYFETQDLEVHSRRPIKASVDGEVNEKTPLKIVVLPRSLRVVVPKNFVADEV